MAETPTSAEVIAERASISEYLPEGVTLTTFITRALADVKRFLRNMQGVEWAQVFDGVDYYTDTDGNSNNADQLLHAITLTTISLVYKEYSQNANESQWWDLYIAYRDEAETLLKSAKLDVDRDESGAIDASEEKTLGQVFLRR